MKIDTSAATSNMLVFFSIALAAAPVLLRDQLTTIVTGLMTDGAVVFDGVVIYVQSLLT
jgi:hypothetical protein